LRWWFEVVWITNQKHHKESTFSFQDQLLGQDLDVKLIIWFIFWIYKNCSESNASYPMMMAHNISQMLMVWQESLNLLTNMPLYFVVVWQMAAEGQSNRMEVCMKWWCVNEFLQIEKKWHPLTFINACWMFIETTQWMWAHPHHGWWVSAEAIAMFQMAMYCYHTKKWRVSWLTQLHKLADYDQGTLYRAKYCLQCVGNNGDNTGILQTGIPSGFPIIQANHQLRPLNHNAD